MTLAFKTKLGIAGGERRLATLPQAERGLARRWRDNVRCRAQERDKVNEAVGGSNFTRIRHHCRNCIGPHFLPM